MSYVPDLNAYGMLSDLGTKIATGFKEAQQKQLLSALGQDLMGGDYQSAAAKALQAGDMATGLKLMELGQQKQNAAALPGLLQGPSFGQQQQAAPQQTGDGSGGDYFKKLAAVESGGNPNAVSPTGAKGVFQFIPSTWKQYGGGADVMDPNAQFVAVQRLTADNRSALASALGREPTAGELYLAHQQGAGGAIKLLSNPGATPAELGLGRNVAVNGGNPNAPAGQFVQKWTSKFDGVGSPLAFGARDQATAPANVAYARPAAAPAASSEDDGEEEGEPTPPSGSGRHVGVPPGVVGSKGEDRWWISSGWPARRPRPAVAPHPWSGGGPGAGPVGVIGKLTEFLPTPVIDYDSETDRYFLNYSYPCSIGKIHSYKL